MREVIALSYLGAPLPQAQENPFEPPVALFPTAVKILLLGAWRGADRQGSGAGTLRGLKSLVDWKHEGTRSAAWEVRAFELGVNQPKT